MNQSSIARSSIVMAAGTLTSRVLGLIRNALLIAALGATASGAADAFNVANMLPTQLYNLIIGGVLNAILVPQIVRAMRQRNGDELVNRLLTAAASIIAAVAALLTIASPLVIMIYASGLGRWQPLAYAFAFWCMPQVFFYGLYALWGQVLNARHSFGPYMWSPVLNNLISIVSILAYLHLYGGYTAGQAPQVWSPGRVALIGATATLGIALQAVVLYVPLRRSGFKPQFIWGFRGLGLGSVSKVAWWALLGTAVSALGDLAATNLGSRAVTAAESAQYADVIVPSTTMYANALMIYMLPQSLVTTSIITALFTRMSEKAAADDRTGVRDDLSLGLRSVGVFTVLFAAGIMTLAEPALQLFVPSLSLEQARACAPVLACMALGIPFQGAWFTNQRVLLAYADTKRLMRADFVVGAVVSLACLLSFLILPAQYWMAGAALGNTTALLAANIAIVPLMHRHLPDLDGARVLSTYTRLVLAVLPAMCIGWLLRRISGPASGAWTGTRAVDAGIVLLLSAVAMTLVYLVAARILRVSELSVVFSPASRITLGVARRLPDPVAGWLTHLAHAMDMPTPPALAASRAAAASSGISHSVPMPGDATYRIGLYASIRTGGSGVMGEGRPIGSGRYRLDSPLPAQLPRVVRHRGWDTILDREVTVLTLTDITPHKAQILEAASRAVLVDDARMQRVYDVETGNPAFIVTQPTSGRDMSRLVAQGLSPAQVRAIIGEVAQVLEACSRRDLHHLNLSPDSVRVDDSGRVQVAGVGIEAAALGLDADMSEPLEADSRDARALVELLYYGLTGRWPGKRTGIPSAPTSGGVPVAPSQLNKAIKGLDADLDVLVARTWGGDAPRSCAELASTLGSWDTSTLLADDLPTAQHGPTSPSSPEPVPGSIDDGRDEGDTAAYEAVSDTSAIALPADMPTTLPAPPPPGIDEGLGADDGTDTNDDSQPSGVGNQDEDESTHGANAESVAVSRTTKTVLAAAAITVLIGVCFAVANLLQLSNVAITDDDIPAAKTVPTAIQSEQAEEERNAQAQATKEATSAPIQITSSQSLDPYGDNNEHPELTSALTDGDPASVWFSRYYASASLDWKHGIGVAVTLAHEATVSGIDIQGTGSGGNVQIRATSPEDPEGGTLLAEGAFTEGTTTFNFPATQATSIVVWVTELPTASDGKLKVTISELTLR